MKTITIRELLKKEFVIDLANHPMELQEIKLLALLYPGWKGNNVAHKYTLEELSRMYEITTYFVSNTNSSLDSVFMELTFDGNYLMNEDGGSASLTFLNELDTKLYYQDETHYYSNMMKWLKDANTNGRVFDSRMKSMIDDALESSELYDEDCIFGIDGMETTYKLAITYDKLSQVVWWFEEKQVMTPDWRNKVKTLLDVLGIKGDANDNN